MKFNHLNVEDLFKSLMKTFNKNLQLRSYIRKKINTTKGGEKVSWIKKYNTLFIIKWKHKNENNL